MSFANSADPDQTPRSAASDLGLHCLLRPVCLCPNRKINYGTYETTRQIMMIKANRAGPYQPVHKHSLTGKCPVRRYGLIVYCAQCFCKGKQRP